MVEETPKPFACTYESCTMSFTNEDHLNVHQKKHDMVLNLGLGSKANTFMADQTPTPTRFLRNCEEVGLFQDLQNVNPFEETFKRAAELIKSGMLPEPEINGDDTLHTPHVFPHLPEENITAIYTAKECETSETVNEEISVNVTINSTEKSDKFYTHDKATFIIESGKIDHDYAMEVTQSGTLQKKTEFVINESKEVNHKKASAKLKLQALLKKKKDTSSVNQPLVISGGHINSTGSTNFQLTTVSVLNNSIPVLTALPDVSKYTFVNVPVNDSVHAVSDSTKMKFRSKDNVGEKPDEKKRSKLESNRAAAIRSREKRKRKIKNLEMNYDNVCKMNDNFQKEVKCLRNEVAHLKMLLLAHKDCPVTKALNKEHVPGVKAASIHVVPDTDSLNKTENTVQIITTSANKITMNSVNNKQTVNKGILPKIIIKDFSFPVLESKANSVIVLNNTFTELPS